MSRKKVRNTRRHIKYVPGGKPGRKLRENEFFCVLCQGIFNKGIGDDQVRAEFMALFPYVSLETEAEIVCDNCWQQLPISREVFG